jgi:hypothetical protein
MRCYGKVNKKIKLEQTFTVLYRELGPTEMWHKGTTDPLNKVVRSQHSRLDFARSLFWIPGTLPAILSFSIFYGFPQFVQVNTRLVLSNRPLLSSSSFLPAYCSWIILLKGWFWSTALDLYLGSTWFESWPGYRPLWQVFYGFPQSLETISEMVPSNRSLKKGYAKLIWFILFA